MKLAANIQQFYADQLNSWPMAADNVCALANVQVKEITLPGMSFLAQYNPARIVSTGAKVYAEAIAARPCFLCATNRPKEQSSIPVGKYEILLNPYPIFSGHLTIAATTHTPQRIAALIADMLGMAAMLPGYTVFYNGPKCGASAPDHLHLQACPTAALPIWYSIAKADARDLIVEDTAKLSVCDSLPVPCFVIEANKEEYAVRLFERMLAVLPTAKPEPMLNVLCKDDGGAFSIIAIPRKAHRPVCYGTGSQEMLISPASVDLGGVIVTPRRCDFERLDADTLRAILADVCLSNDDINAIANSLL